MRVLHVMECTIGGTRKHLVDTALGLAARGVEVSVAASSLRQPDFEVDLAHLERSGVRVHRVAMRRAPAPGSDLAALAKLARIVRDEKPDVVHTHSSKAGALGRLASWHAEQGARVHTPHTYAFLFSRTLGLPMRALYREIERALTLRTDRIVAVSASEARTIAASGVVSPERLRVVPNGIDPAPWIAAEPLERASLCGERSQPLLACVGLLNPAKGQDLLLDALAHPGLEDVQVAIVGHGEDEAALRAQADHLGLAERVRFLGYRRDVPRLLATCDGLVLPSRWEGMPYALLEAMCAGKPVIATPVDGALDLIEPGRNGFLASAIDATALAGALLAWRAAGPTQWERLGREGRARVATGFSLRAMVDGLHALYREVA